jgi:beta-lactam-binding protein with PASTA domain
MRKLLPVAITIGLMTAPLGAAALPAPVLAAATGEEAITVETVTVPNVVGRSVREAGSIVRRAGLQPELFGSGNIIVFQSPDYGRQVPAGSAVSLFKGTG